MSYVEPTSSHGPAARGSVAKVLPWPRFFQGARQPVNAAFGRYRLLERLGQGGMAEVFKAKSYGVEGFEKILVIKRILPELAQEPGLRGHVHPRGQARRAPVAREHRAGLRPRQGASGEPGEAHPTPTTWRWSSCTGSTSRASSRASRRQQLALPIADGRVRRLRGRQGPRPRAPPARRADAAARHRPPRRLAAERAPVVRGRGQGHRLRHRQGARRARVAPATRTRTRKRCRASSAT